MTDIVVDNLGNVLAVNTPGGFPATFTVQIASPSLSWTLTYGAGGNLETYTDVSGNVFTFDSNKLIRCVPAAPGLVLDVANIEDAYNVVVSLWLNPALNTINTPDVNGITPWTGTNPSPTYPIYEIGDGSSSVFSTNSDYLTSIVAWGRVLTTINAYAFQNCTGLTSFSGYSSPAINAATPAVAATHTSIGAYAFDGCSSLTDVTIPASVTTIGMFAFKSCSSLTNIIIPSTVTTINEKAFNNSGLTAIIFLGNYTSNLSGMITNVTPTVYYLDGKSGWPGNFSNSGTIVYTNLKHVLNGSFAFLKSKYDAAGGLLDQDTTDLYYYAFHTGYVPPPAALTLEDLSTYQGSAGAATLTTTLSSGTATTGEVSTALLTLISLTKLDTANSSATYYSAIPPGSYTLTSADSQSLKLTLGITSSLATTISIMAPAPTGPSFASVPTAGSFFFAASAAGTYTFANSTDTLVIDAQGGQTYISTENSGPVSLVAGATFKSINTQTTSVYTNTINYLGSLLTTGAPTSSPGGGGSGAACFLGKAPVLTPSGYRRIDSLKVGDLVSTAEGESVPIQAVFIKSYTPSNTVNPFIIPKGKFGATMNLAISPDHLVQTAPGKMVKARSLGLEQKALTEPFNYYNIELPTYENMIVAGVTVESKYPTITAELTINQLQKFLEENSEVLTPEVLSQIKLNVTRSANGKLQLTTLKRNL